MNYSLFLNNQEISVRTTKVYPAPYNKFIDGEFASFTFTEKSVLKVKSKEKIQNLDIRPKSLGLEYSFSDNEVIINLEKPCNFSLEINGSYINNLLIFASPKREYDFSGYELITIKSGEHINEKLLITKDNTAIYFEDNAVLHGKIELNGCKNILVCGNGIIDGQRYTQLKHRVRFDILACENVKIQDIIILDSLFWNMRIFSSKNVDVDNVKIIGSRPNTDAFDVCSSQNVHIKNCFTRVWDDSLVVKAFDDNDRTSVHVVFEGSNIDMEKAFKSVMNTENLLFENCVLWNDFARPIELGVSLRADKVRNIRFKNIDIIHSPTGYPIMGIHHGDRAEVSDVLIEDVRIEDAPGAQLIDIRITDSVWNLDNKKGSIHDISFKNISINAKDNVPFEKSRLEGLSKENSIKKIKFHNISLQGKTASNASEMFLDIMDYVDDVTVTCDDDREKINFINSQIITTPFELKNGIYEGVVTVKLQNMSKVNLKGEAKIFVSPKHTCPDFESFGYDLAPKECTQFDYKVKLPAGKFVIRVLGNDINVLASWKLIELNWNIKNMNEFDFYNYYGMRKSGVKLDIEDDNLIINSETLKDCDFIIHTAMPVKTQLGEVKFTVEETDFGEALAVVSGKNGDIAAPQLRCPAEIFYVFDNQPKVKEIVTTKIPKNESGKAVIPLLDLGVFGNEFLIEIEAVHKDRKNYRYPLTLFHSVMPQKTAHMFGKVIF